MLNDEIEIVQFKKKNKFTLTFEIGNSDHESGSNPIATGRTELTCRPRNNRYEIGITYKKIKEKGKTRKTRSG
jgi:hypothetical protein